MITNELFDEDGQETIDPEGYFYQDEDSGGACMTSTFLSYLLSVEHSDVMRAITRVRLPGTTEYYHPISLRVGVHPANEMPGTFDAFLIKPTGLVLLTPYLNLHENAFRFAEDLAGKFLYADTRLKAISTEINRVFLPTSKQAAGDN